MRSVLTFMLLSNIVLFGAQGGLKPALSAVAEGDVVGAAGELGSSFRRALYEQDRRSHKRRAFEAERRASRMAG